MISFRKFLWSWESSEYELVHSIVYCAYIQVILEQFSDLVIVFIQSSCGFHDACVIEGLVTLLLFSSFFWSKLGLMILLSSLISVLLWQVRCCFLSYELFIRSSSILRNLSARTILYQFLVPCLLSHVSIVLWFWPSLSQNRFQLRRHGWRITFSLDTGGNSESVNSDSPPGLGGTRLFRIASAVGRQLLEKLNSARKNFPMKIFLLLLGFYMANALARILGQTGEWDALVAGVVVAAIRVIGQPVRA